ncbi:hypothetical protein MRX96_040423 [Rhipicephalus microplus]
MQPHKLAPPEGTILTLSIFERVNNTLEGVFQTGEKKATNPDRMMVHFPKIMFTETEQVQYESSDSHCGVFLISSIAGRIHPSPSKTYVIQQASTPTTWKELEAFLGLLNFYSTFLKGTTEAAEPPIPAPRQGPRMGVESAGEARTTPTPMRSVRLPAPGNEDEPQPPGDLLLLEAVECPLLQAPEIVQLIKTDSPLS